jgi:hypothetical protein
MRSANCCRGLNPQAQLFEVADGDHSFKVRVKITGRKQDAVFTEIFDRVDAFIRSVIRP